MTRYMVVSVATTTVASFNVQLVHFVDNRIVMFVLKFSFPCGNSTSIALLIDHYCQPDAIEMVMTFATPYNWDLFA